MKTLFKIKNLILAACLLVGLVASEIQAQTRLVKVIPPNTITNVLVGAFRLLSVTFISSDTNNGTIGSTYMFDTSNSSTNIAYPAYTNYFPTNVTSISIYTNTAGVLTTNTFASLMSYTNAVAATTNTAPLVGLIVTQGVVEPIGRTLTATYTSKGLTLLSSATGTVYVVYQPAF